jgi:signal peptidase II
MVKRALLIILGVLVIDQASKIYIKLSWPLDHSVHVFGEWFQLHFIENPGMAFGLTFGGETGKLALSIFRLLAIAGIAWYLRNLIKSKHPAELIYAIALILAGAAGNMVDSALYGVFFNEGSVWNGHYYQGYLGLAEFCSPSEGYSAFLLGNVVDMLYFPIINSTWPEWMPIIGGEDFQFFRPVFNISDAAITIGVAWIILRQRSVFKQLAEEEVTSVVADESTPSELTSTEERKPGEA